MHTHWGEALPKASSIIRQFSFYSYLSVLTPAQPNLLTPRLLRYPAESERRLGAWAARRHPRMRPDQLVFSDFVDTAEENLERLRRGAHAVLDTTVYGAHTGCKSLSRGVPKPPRV